ncbi:MAG TPA: UV DNA damage repair endonuclease UvsE [Gemmatimonadales bacterium]|nr:UV DNA damage repair endonuclease UvsE [Gemmatimonadales bacterium]
MGPGALRFGLCCQFLDAPIRFRSATHRYVSGLAPGARAEYLRAIARANAASLLQAVEACAALGIGAFRITSQILPLGTHPSSGYSLESLDADGSIQSAFRTAGAMARALDVRLSFHPDQFVVLNSVREDVVASSVRELDFQARLAALIGADTLVLHGGSMTGGRDAAIERLARGIDRLGGEARARLALENDDRRFTPADLVPLARRSGVPLVYDVHHHRCHPDGLDVEEATAAAAETWGGREPWAHISSPRDGWSAANPRPHADYVDPADVPAEWIGRRLTIDVEAKAKERAVVAIMAALAVGTG